MSLAIIAFYLVACFSVTVLPGPTMLLAFSNGVSRRWGVVCMGMLGAACSDLLLIGAVSVGLGALLAASTTVFSLVKWIGVAYLVWLAVQLWRQEPGAGIAVSRQADLSGRRVFLRNFLVALSNPKGLLFFSAFLPQFIDPAQSQTPQYATLAVLTAILDVMVMTCYALGGLQAARLLTARGLRCLNRACASALISLAAALAAYRRVNG